MAGGQAITYTAKHTHTYIHTYTHTYIQTDRHTHIHACIQRNTHTVRQRGSNAAIDSDIHTCTNMAGGVAERPAHWMTDGLTHWLTGTDRPSVRHTGQQADTHREIQTGWQTGS